MSMLPNDTEIGIFGGTGFYSLLSDAVDYDVPTPYGDPSDTITVGNVAGHKVAFLPRHGSTHTVPPHKINYRANLDAFKQLGIRRIIAPTACGSLQSDIFPGDFVVSDQFVDRTRARQDTYYDGPVVTHISGHDPYCGQLRELACQQIESHCIPLHRTGTSVVIQGPRFSTKAESEFFSRCGWSTINMTQYPEVVLARELAMCYVNIALVTDYDAGVTAPAGYALSSTEEIMRVLGENNDRVKSVIHSMVANMPADFTCGCGQTLAASQIR